MIEKSNIEHRFSQLVEQRGAKAPWDTALLELERYVVAPTLGSILPNWLLVVPKEPVLNYALSDDDSCTPFELLSQIARSLGAGDDWIGFEHGAAEKNSPVGCGVDYAHLHLLLAPPFRLDDLLANARSRSAMPWQDGSSREIYRQISGTESYYTLGDQRTAWRCMGANLGSQFFRKIVAELCGVPDKWDYKQHPFAANVGLTLASHSSHLVAAE